MPPRVQALWLVGVEVVGAYLRQAGRISVRCAIRWRLPLQLTSLRPAAQRGCFRDCPAASKAGRPAYFLRVFADNLSSWAGIQRILFTFVFANFHFLHFRSLRLLRNFTADICFVGVLTFSFFRSTAI